jgi:YD repeat-containing protein
MLKIYIVLFLCIFCLQKNAFSQWMGAVPYSPAFNFEDCDTTYIIFSSDTTNSDGKSILRDKFKCCQKNAGGIYDTLTLIKMDCVCVGLITIKTDTETEFYTYDDLGNLKSIVLIDNKKGDTIINMQMLPIFDTIFVTQMKKSPLYHADTAIVLQRCNETIYIYNPILGKLSQTIKATWADNIRTVETLSTENLTVETFSDEILNESGRLYVPISWRRYNLKGKLIKKVKLKKSKNYRIH